MKIIIIVAVSDNFAIGLNGKMPWHNSDDLKFFKNTTMGYPIVMGRKTYESLGRPLPGRLNIVVTKNQLFDKDQNIVILNDLKDLTSQINKLKENDEFSKQYSFDKCFIIGGGSVYQQSIDIADEIIMSRINGTYEADTFFPKLDDQWILTETKDFETFKVEFYKRK